MIFLLRLGVELYGVYGFILGAFAVKTAACNPQSSEWGSNECTNPFNTDDPVGAPVIAVILLMAGLCAGFTAYAVFKFGHADTDLESAFLINDFYKTPRLQYLRYSCAFIVFALGIIAGSLSEAGLSDFLGRAFAPWVFAIISCWGLFSATDAPSYEVFERYNAPTDYSPSLSSLWTPASSLALDAWITAVKPSVTGQVLPKMAPL